MSCCIVSSIDRLDDGKASLTIKRLSSLLSDSSLNIIDNRKIGHLCLGIHGLHLNEHCAGKLALNFVKRKRPIRNSGCAKQKLKEVTQKSVAFEGQETIQDLIILRQYMPHRTTRMRKL